MSEYVMLTSDREKLRSYSASSKGGRHIIRIEIEVSDARDLGHILHQLGAYEDAQRHRAKRRSTAAPLLLTHDNRGDG